MRTDELSHFLADQGLLSPSSANVPSIVDLAGTISKLIGPGPELSASARGAGPLRESGPGPESRTGPRPELPGLSERLEQYRGVVFVIADGLGIEQMEHIIPNGFLASTLLREMRSVHPSTTATALTSLATARWAGTHGVTGWWTHLPHLSRTICPLTFRERATGVYGSSLGLDMGDIVSAPSLYGGASGGPGGGDGTRPADAGSAGASKRGPADEAGASSAAANGGPGHGDAQPAVYSLLPKNIAESSFARFTRADTPIYPYRSIAHAVRRAARLAERTTGRFFINIYHPDLDSAVHKWGHSHAETYAVARRLDHHLEKLRKRLPSDVALVVTADHGLVTLDPALHTVVEDDHPLLDHLMLPPTGEGTNPFFHVKPGEETQFHEELARTRAGEAFRLVETDTLGEAGFFGPAGITPAVRQRFGTHTGIAVEPALLEYVPAGRRSVKQRAVHGGLRPQEMRVPLCLAVR